MRTTKRTIIDIDPNDAVDINVGRMTIRIDLNEVVISGRDEEVDLGFIVSGVFMLTTFTADGRHLGIIACPKRSPKAPVSIVYPDALSGGKMRTVYAMYDDEIIIGVSDTAPEDAEQVETQEDEN